MAAKIPILSVKKARGGCREFHDYFQVARAGGHKHETARLAHLGSPLSPSAAADQRRSDVQQDPLEC
ncbi:MAG: hypothetical protein FJ272_02395 [Planctomycetes bacterium]|nr:hypothetical protein [Planctomycetota bacterium]